MLCGSLFRFAGSCVQKCVGLLTLFCRKLFQTDVVSGEQRSYWKEKSMRRMSARYYRRRAGGKSKIEKKMYCSFDDGTGACGVHAKVGKHDLSLLMGS